MTRQHSAPARYLVVSNMAETGGVGQQQEQGLSKRKTLADHIHPGRGILTAVFSIIMYILDVGSDIALAVRYFTNGHTIWGALTITFVLLAQLLLFCMGLCMATGWRKLITPVLPVIIEVKNIRSYMEIKRYNPAPEDKVYKKVLDNEHGKVFLKMVEVVFESLPELFLQLYIVCVLQTEEHPYTALQTVSIVTALISISFTTASLRRIDLLQCAEYNAPELSISHDALHVLSSSFVLMSRVACFVLFTASFKYYILIVILGHFICYFLWLSVNINTDGYADAAMIALLASISALFTPDHFLTYEYKEDIPMPGSLPCRYWAYNLLHLVENVILICCWYIYDGCHQTSGYVILIIVIVAMFVGFMFDVVTRWRFTPQFLLNGREEIEDGTPTPSEHDEPMIDNAV